MELARNGFEAGPAMGLDAALGRRARIMIKMKGWRMGRAQVGRGNSRLCLVVY